MADYQAQAQHLATLAEDMATPAESPKYKRLTAAEQVSIIQLHDRGWSQSAIAKHLKRSVSTVHETLQLFSPTIDLAKRKLAAAALRMADNVIENGKPSDHVAVLKGTNVLEEREIREIHVTIDGVLLAGMGLGASQPQLEPPSPHVEVIEGESQRIP